MTSKDQGLAGDLAAREMSDEQIDAIANEVFPADPPISEMWCESVGRPFARAVLAARALATPVATPPSDDNAPLELFVLDTGEVGRPHWNAVVDGPGPHGFMRPDAPKRMAVRYMRATGEPTVPWKLTGDAIVKQDREFGQQKLLPAGTVVCGEPTDATENAKLREALKLAHKHPSDPAMWLDEVSAALAASKEQQ